MTPAEVRDEITKSGLRGRGGAGYPTGLKWNTVAKATGSSKYVICNADEGDPGAFMDRSILESDPHRVLEGMAIAAYAVGANFGLCVLPRRVPARGQPNPDGHPGRLPGPLPGQLDHGHRVLIRGRRPARRRCVRLRRGDGAHRLHRGRAGHTHPAAPYPAVAGLWDKPTLINNVETFANVAPIIRNGGDWFASIGTATSKGTKVFALAGRVVNTGLVEVPMGTTLREIVFDIGGGIVDGHAFKAVQTGGPAGGCIPAQFLDMPVDYESLMEVGSFMGSGGMIVMDETSCMVNVAKYFMDFCREESCGKCAPCRVGTTQLWMLLDKISRGLASMDDLTQMERLARMVQRTSLCGLGQGAPNPIFSTLRFFKDEYLAHVQDRVCPAGACTMDPEPVPA